MDFFLSCLDRYKNFDLEISSILNSKLITVNKIFSFIYQNQLLAADLSKNGPQLVLFDTYSETVRREDFNRHFRFAEHHR